MGNYSSEEIAEFKAKDLRVSKLAILKSLIEKSELEDVYEATKLIELTDVYINYVYEHRECAKKGQVSCVADNAKNVLNWEQVAKGLNLAIPNSQNVKILNLVMDEYKKAHKASANPNDILVHIMDTFGVYPENPESVSKIVNSLLMP